jgi:putative endonuclease
MLFLKKRLFSDTDLLGRWGEKQAINYLKSKGMHTLALNYTCKTGEIDLIMVDTNSSVVFVEVKTRKSEDFTPAESVIAAEKQGKMQKSARYFLASNEIEDRPYRFDAVTIVLDKNGSKTISHFKNAFVL